MSVLASAAATVAPRSVPPLTEQDAEGGLLDRFEVVVRAQPDAVAVADAAQALTYADVAAGAGRIASGLRARGLSPADGDPLTAAVPVAVLRGHDVGAVVAVVGVLGAGRPVLVLDPTTPVRRLRQYVQTAGVELCVTDAAHADVARQVCADVLVADDGGPAAARDERPAGALPAGAEDLFRGPRPGPDAPASLITTSGTTGTPKGVVASGRFWLHDSWAGALGTGFYDADDVVAHTLPLAFTAGLGVTLAGLLVGSTQHLYDPREHGIAGLAPWMRRVGATVLYASPAILRAVVAALGPDDRLDTLRSLTIVGEPAYARDVEAVRPHLSPSCTVHNRYGSSETGLLTDATLPAGQPLPDAGPLPVGRPVPGMDLTLEGPDGESVPVGETGTVVVTTRYAALGYWRAPDRTAAVFSPAGDGRTRVRTSDIGRLRPDGRLEIVGRRDHSLKVRGYLVEPGEIEAALMAMDDVREAVVVGVRDETTGRARLVAWISSSAERPSATVVRTRLRSVLPLYMVPETVAFLDRLPRTERGKLDRAALPPPPAPAVGGRQPRDSWERSVAEVWARVLGIEGIGTDDDFFEVGGDSLAAEALVSTVVIELGVDESQVSTSLLMSAPTVRQFAARLQRTGATSGSATLVPLRAGTGRPLFFVAGAGGLAVGVMSLVRRLDPALPVWGLQARGLEGRALPHWSVQARAADHLAELRAVQPHGPYLLAGHSSGGLVALELAHRLRALGEQVDLLAVLDSFPPDPAVVPRPRPGSAAWVRGRARRVVDLAQIALTAGGLLPAAGHEHFMRHHRHSAAVDLRYRSEPWPGRTLVVVADSPEAHARSQWGPHLRGEWELARCGGGHIGMLREPHAGDVARALSAALARAGVPETAVGAPPGA